MKLSELSQVVFGAKVATAPVLKSAPMMKATVVPMLKAPTVFARAGSQPAVKTPTVFAKAAGAGPSTPPPPTSAGGAGAAGGTGAGAPAPSFTTFTAGGAPAAAFTFKKVASTRAPVTAMFVQPAAQPAFVAPDFDRAGPLVSPAAAAAAKAAAAEAAAKAARTATIAECDKRGGSWTGKECVFPAALPAEPAQKTPDGTTVIEETKAPPAQPTAEPIGVGDRVTTPQGEKTTAYQYDTAQPQQYAAPGEFQVAAGEEALPEAKLPEFQGKTAAGAEKAADGKKLAQPGAKITSSTEDNKVKYGLGILLAAGVGYLAYLKFKKPTGAST